MLPTYILLKIIDYLPINEQLLLFQLSHSMYDKSTGQRTLYRSWWNKYKNNQYNFTDLKFTQYLFHRGFKRSGYELNSACRGGNIACIQLLIDQGARDWNGGLYGACLNGHIECIRLMIDHGAREWYWGLYYACIGGYIDCVRLLIERGADEWNSGLSAACKGGHMGCIRLMIEHGATKCKQCKRSMESHLKN